MSKMPKLKIEDVKVVANVEVARNFNQFNVVQNDYNLKTTDSDLKFPKYLLISVLAEMNAFCESAFIDASKYKFADVSKMDDLYQVDFFSDEKMKSYKISIYEIYYDSKRKKILQSCRTLD
jgi:hypothetical protein